MGKILELLKKKANNSGFFSPNEEMKERLSVCKKCEFFIKKTTQCEKCLCFMKLKTRLRNASCPVDKW